MIGEATVPSGVGLDLRLVDGGSIRQHTKRDGTFSFTGLPPGTHELELAVVAALGDAKPPSVPIERGAEDILFSLDGARTLRFALEYPEMLLDDMEVLVASHDGSQRAKGAWSHLDTGGLVLGTEPGHVYDVLIRHEGANLAALVDNLDPAGGAFVPLAKAAAIAGRVRLPADVSTTDVEGELSRRGIRIPVHLSSDGTFRIPALPGGSTWTLRLEAPTGEILPEVVVQDVLVGATRSIEVSFE